MKLTIAHYMFPDDEIRQLREYRDKQRDGRLRVRFVVLLLLAEEVLIETVARVVGVSIKTIERWGEQYLTKGIDALNSFNYKAKQPYLKPWQIEQLVIWVKQTNPAKAKHVKTYITEQFGVTYSVEAVRVLMRKQGLRRLRPPTQPGNPREPQSILSGIRRDHRGARRRAIRGRGLQNRATPRCARAA